MDAGDAFAKDDARPGAGIDVLRELGEQAVEIAEAVSLVLLQPELATRCTVRISPPARIWYYPVETINNSEHGYERILQGGCLVTLHAVGQARLTIRQSDV